MIERVGVIGCGLVGYGLAEISAASGSAERAEKASKRPAGYGADLLSGRHHS